MVSSSFHLPKYAPFNPHECMFCYSDCIQNEYANHVDILHAVSVHNKTPLCDRLPLFPHAPLSIQPTGARPASTFTYVLTGRKWMVVLIIGTPFTTGCNPSIRIIETPSNNLKGFQGACGGRARGGICNIENYLDGLFHEDNDKLM